MSKIFKNDSLLPCPHCGSERMLGDDAGNPTDIPASWFVLCCDRELPCGACWPWADTKKKAIGIANRGCWRDIKQDGYPRQNGELQEFIVQLCEGTIVVAQFYPEQQGDTFSHWGYCGKKGSHILYDYGEDAVAWMPLPPVVKKVTK